jgi:arylsulfatase A-like enzyme
MKSLVIVAGGLHLGYLGCYGNDWIDTPALDELAASSVVFDQHYADAPDVAGARRSWRTGRYQFPMLEASPIATGGTDVLAALKQQGVTTFLILDGSRPHDTDFAQGWDHVKIAKGDRKETALVRTLEAVQKALDRCTRLEHWLIWVELAPLRPPWDVPDEFRNRFFLQSTDDDTEDDSEEEATALQPWTGALPDWIDEKDDATFLRLQRTYAGAVAYLDAGLDMLLQDLAARELQDELLLVLTSDHGLPLGEHGVVGLGQPWLHDELAHVPLLLRLPGEAEAGRRVPALTQAVDLGPTLLDAFGAPLPPVHGHSLLPLARGATEQMRDYAVMGLQVGADVEWALRSPDYSFLLPLRTTAERLRAPQLYVKPDDRWEVNDLIQHHLEWTEQLERTLRNFVAATQPPGPVQAPLLPAEALP